MDIINNNNLFELYIRDEIKQIKNKDIYDILMQLKYPIETETINNLYQELKVLLKYKKNDIFIKKETKKMIKDFYNSLN